MFLGLPFHAAEFIEIEDLAVFADARLDIEDFMGVAGDEISDLDNKSNW